MKHTPHSAVSVADLMLDGTKVAWHQDRIALWKAGKRFAPITIDMALTVACQASCGFCYAVLQGNKPSPITKPVISSFLSDCADIGVKAISLVSDGESTLSPVYEYTIQQGYELGLCMASGTNGILVTKDVSERILPSLTYIRVNINAATEEANCRIMGIKPEWHCSQIQNLKDMVAIKERDHLPVTIGMQQVLMPQYGEEILPLARLAVDLGVDYLVIKHCSDDEFGSLGVNYSDYEKWYPTLEAAEALSNGRTQITAKWSKIQQGNRRTYSRCYGPPFILQISGSGLVAPCGMLFGERYRKFHIGSIVTESFKDIVFSDRYWEVMDYLSSDKFDARRMCGSLCLQDRSNVALDEYKKGVSSLEQPEGPKPKHSNFI